MSNMKTRKYHFESSHVPYSVRSIEVVQTNEMFKFVVDDVENIINLNDRSLERKSDELEMLFDFENKNGYIMLIETKTKLPFEIIEEDLKLEGDILHLDFKYILDEEMYISLSIT